MLVSYFCPILTFWSAVSGEKGPRINNVTLTYPNKGGGDAERSEGNGEAELGLLALVLLVLAVAAGGRVGDSVVQLDVVGLARREAVASQDTAGGDDPLGDGALLEVVLGAEGLERLGFDLLALLGEDHGVGLELEEEVRAIDDQEDDGGTAGELGDVGLGRPILQIEGSRNDNRGDGKGEKGSGGLCDGGVEVLFGSI